MILPRVIPSLLLRGSGLVKTIRFRDPVYIGDPRNAVKIFNEREVDELVLLDIQATPKKSPIQFDLVHEIVSEAFMPVGYGGGIQCLEDAQRLLALGIEKIILCTEAVRRPSLLTEIANRIGSQSLVVCIDYKRSLLGRNEVYIAGGRQKTGIEPVSFALEMEQRGAGELLFNSIDRDGTMQGYDLQTIQAVTEQVTIPVIASGGAGKLGDFRIAIDQAGASAVAAGSLFCFQGRQRAVLINYPGQDELRQILT